MISIVTAYYNRKELLLNTINSIIKSKHNNYEFIIVDDGSDIEHNVKFLEKQYNFIKVIEINKKNKTWKNSCIPFNIGFKETKGDIVLIQNPECLHFGDILTHVEKNLKENQYFSYGCYSLDEINTINCNYNILNKTVNFDGDNGWYNHSIYRPVGYHFCSAIFKNKLSILNGFDERYSNGIGFDDNEFLYRIINNLKLEKHIIDNPFVIHQYHYKNNIKYNESPQILVERNKNLYYNKTLLGL